MSKVKVKDVPKGLWEEGVILLAGLSMLRDGANPDRDPARLIACIEEYSQVKEELSMEIKLSDIPDLFRGGVGAEWLAQFEILKLGVSSCRDTKIKYANLDVSTSPVKNPIKVSVQVKLSSLKKHGQVIQVNTNPLERFEGWYIAVIERDPEDKPKDDFLYILEMKRLMEEIGKDHIENGKKIYSFIDVKKNWRALEPFLDSRKFVEAVKGSAGGKGN
jgi:hypothetical protein